jgi:hypothetical protein
VVPYDSPHRYLGDIHRSLRVVHSRITAEQAEMQPHARGAGTAVERERHRAACGILAVGGDEDLGPGLGAVELVVGLVFLTKHDPPGGGRVAQLAVVERDRAPGGDQVVGGLGVLRVGVLGLGVGAVAGLLR